MPRPLSSTPSSLAAAVHGDHHRDSEQIELNEVDHVGPGSRPGTGERRNRNAAVENGIV